MDSFITRTFLMSSLLFTLIILSGAFTSGYAEETAKSEESVRIAKYPDHVRRDGETLYLEIESGAYIALKDTQSCVYPSACDYEFLDYYSDLGFYLVFAGYYEGEDYILISDGDGKDYSVKELPSFSPNKERIVSVSACEVYCNNGVFIWHIVGDGLVSELFYEPEEYARYSFVKWKDDRSIELTKKINSTEQLCPKSDSMMLTVTLQLEEGGWRFYDDLNRQNIRCGP